MAKVQQLVALFYLLENKEDKSIVDVLLTEGKEGLQYVGTHGPCVRIENRVGSIKITPRANLNEPI